jgi:uncharacterized protein (DUF58 family)
MTVEGRSPRVPRLTPTGWGALLGGGLLAALGWVLGYPQLVVMALVCVLALLLAVPAMAVRYRFEARRQVVPPRVTTGESCLGELSVTNRSTRPNPAVVAVDHIAGELVRGEIGRLRPGATGLGTYAIPTDRRGVFTVGPLLLERRDPLGLLRVRQSYGGEDSLWVYPRTHDIDPLPVGLDRDLDGPTSDSAPEGTVTFHTLREYVVGDDLRAIHWKSTARTGKLMVRKHVDTSQPQITIVLDTRRSVHSEESFERAVEVVASMVVSSSRRNCPVRVRTTCGQEEHGPGGRTTTRRLMDHLAAVQPADGGSLTEVSARLGADGVGAALVVVTAGGVDATDVATVARLRRRFDRFAIVNARPEAGTIPSTLTHAAVLDAPDGPSFALAWNLWVHR